MKTEINLRVALTILGVALAVFLGALESTVVGTAMPTVVASLGGIEIYSWSFTAYILAATIMTPIWGKMADLIGRRPAMFGGLTLFVVGSALSGAAQSMPQLISFRVVQGLGAAALFPVGVTILADTLTLEQRARTIGIFSGMWAVASLLGPIVGGYLTTYLVWRWCFYLSIPFGLVAFVLIWWNYQEKYARREEIHLDYRGTITISVALVVLLLIVERSTSLTPLPTLLGAAFCVLLLVVFIRIERRHADPLIPLEIFRNRIVTLTVLHGFIAMMGLIGSMSFLPLFVQAVIGTNAAEAGKILIPYILPWTISSIAGGRLMLRYGYRPLALVGMVSMTIGSLILAGVSMGTTRTQLSIGIGLMGLGGGLTIATMMLAAQHAVARTMVGVTTSTVMFARNIGAAIGTASMGTIMSWRLRNLLATAPAELSTLARRIDVGSIVRPETRTSLSSGAANFLQESMAGSLRWSFRFVFVTVVAATIVSFFIPAGSAHELTHPDHQ